MSKGFKSNDFAFRPTALSDAFARAGGVAAPAFVREPKVLGVPVEGQPFVIPA